MIWSIVEFRACIKRDEMDMSVWHVRSHDLDADIFRPQNAPEMISELFDAQHECLVVFVAKIPYKLYRRLGYDKHVTRLDGVDIEKSVRFVVFVDFMGRNLAVDDFREKS